MSSAHPSPESIKNNSFTTSTVFVQDNALYYLSAFYDSLHSIVYAKLLLGSIPYPETVQIVTTQTKAYTFFRNIGKLGPEKRILHLAGMESL